MRNETDPKAATPRASSSPEPPFAERVRTLLHLGRTGLLSTQSHKHVGFPFGSLAPYGIDGSGRPSFLFSTLAVHARNISGDRRCSLLVTPTTEADPLSASRATLLGQVNPVSEEESAAVRDDYIARHPEAARWAGFGDFSFYRMEILNLYYVAGFGAMGWVDAEEYRRASPDPLADSARGIIEHMNTDHADALILYCRAFAGTNADAATMTAVDRMGFRVRATAGGESHDLRINFPEEAGSPLETRKTLVAMLATARAASSSS